MGVKMSVCLGALSPGMVRKRHTQMQKWVDRAASKGNLRDLKKMYRSKNGPAMRAAWHERTTSLAEQRGHRAVLKWLVCNGCPLSQEAFYESAYKGDSELVDMMLHRRATAVVAVSSRGSRYINASVARTAATRSGCISMLDWLYRTRGVFPRIECVVRANKPRVLEWMIEKDIPVALHLVQQAAANMANLDILKWCGERGAVLGTAEVNMALAQDDRVFLEWLVTSHGVLNNASYHEPVVVREIHRLVGAFVQGLSCYHLGCAFPCKGQGICVTHLGRERKALQRESECGVWLGKDVLNIIQEMAWGVCV